jgi:hypothetical protein
MSGGAVQMMGAAEAQALLQAAPGTVQSVQAVGEFGLTQYEGTTAPAITIGPPTLESIIPDGRMYTLGGGRSVSAAELRTMLQADPYSVTAVEPGAETDPLAGTPLTPDLLARARQALLGDYPAYYAPGVILPDQYVSQFSDEPSTFQRGGFVPGMGRGDTVPAMLEPGEFVVPREAAQRLAPELEKIREHAASSEVVVIGPADQPVSRQQHGTASVPGSGRGDTVPAMLEPQEAVIPREAAQQNRPLIEEIIETGRPVSLEKLQAVVVQVERRLRYVEETHGASPEEVTAAAAAGESVEGPTTEPGVYHEGGEVRRPIGAVASGDEIPAMLLRGEWVTPQAPAQQNRTLLEEIQRFGRSVSLEKIQETIAQLQAWRREVTQQLTELREETLVGEPSDSLRDFREGLLRDEQFLTRMLREFARLNQARDLRLLPVAAGTVNF